MLPDDAARAGRKPLEGGRSAGVGKPDRGADAPVTSAFDMTAWMDTEAAGSLAAASPRRSYRAKQCIYEQDAPAFEMYRIVHGYVRLSVRDADGREAVFLQFGPGDFFGASSLVDQQPRPHSAEAVTAVDLDVIGRPLFDRMRAEHPSFNEALMRLFVLQMRVASTQLVNIHLCGLPARVAKRLIELANMHDEGEEMPGEIVMRVSQAELAGLAGASRQRVNKVLGGFQSKGLLVLQSGSIIVRDLDGLGHAAGN